MGRPTAINPIISRAPQGVRFQVTMGHLARIKTNLQIKNPNRLEARPLEMQIIGQVDLLQGKISTQGTITLADLTKYEDLFHQYQQGPTTEIDVNVLETLENALVGLKEAANLPVAAEEAKADLPVQEQGLKQAEAARRIMVRDQVLQAEDLKINTQISLDSAIDLAKQGNLSAEKIASVVGAKTHVAAPSPAMEMVGQFIVAQTISNLAQDIAYEAKYNQSVSRDALDRIVNDHNQPVVAETTIVEKIQPGTNAATAIEITGSSKKAEAIQAASDLASAQPAQALPALLKMAVATIQQNPGERSEIIQVFSEVAKTQSAVLPVLFSEYDQTQPASNPTNEIIEAVLPELVKGEAGQAYVLQAFVDGKEKALIASPTGQQIVPQTVEAMLDKAGSELAPPVLNLNDQSKTEQLASLGQLFVIANQVKLSDEDLTVDTAQKFLKFVAQAQRALVSITPKEADRLQNPEIVTRPVTSENEALRGREILSNLITSASEAGLTIPTQLLTVIGSHMTDINNYLAGAAGITGMKGNANNSQALANPQTFQVPQESARATSLQAVVSAMDARAEQALPEATQGQVISNTSSAIAAELLVYGLILKRVKGDMERTLEMIRALEKEGLLKKLILALKGAKHKEKKGQRQKSKTTKKYNVDDVDQFIAEITTAVRLHEANRLSIQELVNRIIALNLQAPEDLPLAA